MPINQKCLVRQIVHAQHTHTHIHLYIYTHCETHAYIFLCRFDENNTKDLGNERDICVPNCAGSGSGLERATYLSQQRLRQLVKYVIHDSEPLRLKKCPQFVSQVLSKLLNFQN